MLRQIFEFIRRLFYLVRDLERTREEIVQLRRRRELSETNSSVRQLAYDVQRVSEIDTHERKKLTLQVENTLLRFERQLKPPLLHSPKK